MSRHERHDERPISICRLPVRGAIFTFALPLDAPVYHWVVWKHDRYERFVLPKVGDTAVIEG